MKLAFKNVDHLKFASKPGLGQNFKDVSNFISEMVLRIKKMLVKKSKAYILKFLTNIKIILKVPKDWPK